MAWQKKFTYGVNIPQCRHTQRVSNKGMKRRSLCVWLIIIITWGESIWRTNCCTRTWSNGLEEKNDQMVPQTFQKAIELYSSQFAYRQVTGRNIQRLSYRIQLWKVGSQNMRVLWRRGVYREERHLTTQFHGWLKDIFWEKWHPKLKNQTLEEVCCVLKARKKENFSALPPSMWYEPLLGRLLWAVSHEALLLR